MACKHNPRHNTAHRGPAKDKSRTHRGRRKSLVAADGSGLTHRKLLRAAKAEAKAKA